MACIGFLLRVVGASRTRMPSTAKRCNSAPSSQEPTWTCLWLWGWISLSADADSCHYTAWWTMLLISLGFIVQYLLIIGTVWGFLIYISLYIYIYFFFLLAGKAVSTVWSIASLQAWEKDSLFDTPLALDTNLMTKLLPRDQSMSSFSFSEGHTTWPLKAGSLSGSWSDSSQLCSFKASTEQVVARVCTLPPHLPEPVANNLEVISYCGK